MKKTVLAALVGVLFVLSTLGVAASPSGGSAPDKVGVILYMIDAEDKPLANTTILMQEDLDAQDAYEGETDKLGIMMIPNFPFTGFVMAVRDADNALSGLVDVTLYPGPETKIMNNPRSDNDRVTLDELRDTTLSEHINGAAPLEIAGGADSIVMYRYEVQVSEEAGGVGALFKTARDNELRLEGVSDGQPGGAIPEPTLPPDADDRPTNPPSSSQTPTPSPSPSPSATAEPSPSETAGPSDTAEPSDSAEPTETSGSVSPSPSASETAQEGSPSPSAEPSGEPTPTPTPAPPSPTPTAAPTTQSNLINMKLFLKDPEGKALPYYKTVLNGSVEATTNGEGEAYYTNVATNVSHQLAVYNPEGAEMGSCGIEFVPGNSTSLASVNTGGNFKIDYQQGTQDVYVELVVSTNAAAVESASRAPITGGTTQHSSGSGGGGSRPSSGSASATEDVIGTPHTTETTPAGPTLRGYFSNEAGTAIPGVTVRLRNEDTKALSSAITTADGSFVISQLPPGNYSLGALNPQGANLGEVDFTAARGSKTQLKESNGTLYLSEAQDSDTVYMDVRELSNGTLGIMYAAKSPMLAPAVPGTPEAALSAEANLPAVEEEVDATIVETPTTSGNNGAVITIIAILVGGGAAALIYLLTRRTRIK